MEGLHPARDCFFLKAESWKGWVVNRLVDRSQELGWGEGEQQEEQKHLELDWSHPSSLFYSTSVAFIPSTNNSNTGHTPFIQAQRTHASNNLNMYQVKIVDNVRKCDCSLNACQDNGQWRETTCPVLSRPFLFTPKTLVKTHFAWNKCFLKSVLFSTKVRYIAILATKQ